MKRKILAQKFLAFALTASVVAGMSPTSAFAITGSQVAADGTYTSTAHVTRTEDDSDDEWNEYDVKVSLTVKDGKFSDITVTPENGYNSDNDPYFNKAYNKSKGLKTKVEGQDATADTISNWDTVSGATRRSTAIKSAALEALGQASEKKDEVADEYVYCYAGLTWSEYWAAEGVQASGSTASSDVVDAKGEYDKGAFDTVTRATTNHGLHRGSFQCNATIELNDGTKYNLAYWKDKDTFVTTDGTEVAIADIKANIKDYKVTGLKFVPVKVKAEDYEAFKAKYSVFENGSELKGGYAEGKLGTIDEVANVTENTNGLKTATKNADGSFSFSARATGTDSGVKDVSLKKADGLEPEVKPANGSFGEFLRVDFNGNYGDLGANMQAVKWTYYGNDSTRTKALATYGTKFASDNWMHKSMGIQLGLTDSLRCSLPDGYDGTGYWSLTIYALGYEDYTYNFEATDANIVKPQVPADEASKTALSDKVAEAEKLDKDLYTEKTWADMQTELGEAKDALADESLTQSVAEEALAHLTAAIEGLNSQYVLMNIPYDEFYKANITNDVKVDAFTSATKTKTRSGSLAAGSYHTDATGDAINGVTFPVKVTDDFYTDNKYTRITDESSVDITTNMKGQTTTTTYTGKDALFESGDYSYYVLSEIPSYWKAATINADGSYSFGKTNGVVTEIKDGVTPELKTTSRYGDYQLNLDGLKTAMGYDKNDTASIYGVIVSTKEGNDYGMRHIENIWKVEELAWSTGFTTVSKGCTLSSAHYESMMGQHINKVTYYTDKGIFTVAVGGEKGIYVPVKADTSAAVEDAKVTAGQTELTVSLPADFDAEYTFTDAKGNTIDGFEVKEETTATAGVTALAAEINTVEKKLVITYPDSLENTAYTLTISDKAAKYASVSTTFELIAEKIPAAYNDDAVAPKLVMAENATAAQFADYIAKITSVNVNGKDYAASGRGAVKIIKEDGTIDTTAAAFAEGDSFEITVNATGYEAYTFTYVKPVVIDTADLESAIAKAESLKEADYTAESWKTFSDMLASAKSVLEQKDDQEKVDTATESLNKAIANLKKKDTSSNPSGGQQGGSGIGAGTGTTVSTGNKKADTNVNTNTAKNTTVKKASKTGDTNPLWSMTVVAFAAICLIAAGIFRRKSVRK
ncbi:penicillin-binding Tp47 domain C-containing protein [Agathobacter sp.]